MDPPPTAAMALVLMGVVSYETRCTYRPAWTQVKMVLDLLYRNFESNKD